MTEEQLEDYKKRVKEAEEMLKGLGLEINAAVAAVEITKGVVATQVTPYLKDIKFEEKAEAK